MMRWILAFILILSTFTKAESANYQLTIHLPITSGTSPDVGGENIQANHRIFWAYPGLLYEIQAAVRGGLYPYRYSLTAGVPSGMTINATTGVISWTAPSVANGTAYGPITLSVTDSENTTVTSQWTVTVDTTHFVFVNADYAGTESGTVSQPYNSLADIYNTAGAGKIVYLRGSTANYKIYGYGIAEVTDNTLGCFRRQQWNTNSRSVQFLAYPGESPVWDFGKALEPIYSTSINTTNGQLTVGRWGDIWATGDHVTLVARRYADSPPVDAAGTLPTGFSTGTSYYIRRVDATHITLHPTASDATNNTNVVIPSDQGGTADTYTIIGNAYLYVSGGTDPVYFDGITFQNGPNKMLNFINLTHFRVIRNSTFHHQYGCGGEQNSAFIMGEGNGRTPGMNQSHYPVYQNLTMYDYWDGSAIKEYAERYMIYDGLTIHDGHMVTCTQSVTCPGHPGTIEGLAIKGGYMLQPTIRNNVIHTMASDGLSGNNDAVVGGEYYCNRVYNITDNAVRINQNGAMYAPVYWRRNTFVGRINTRMNLDPTLATSAAGGVSQLASDVGPFYFDHNVIVNDDGAQTPNYFYPSGSGGAQYSSEVQLTNNVTGGSASGIVDSNGLLTGASRTLYLGTHGAENCSLISYNATLSGTARFSGTVRIQ